MQTLAQLFKHLRNNDITGKRYSKDCCKCLYCQSQKPEERGGGLHKRGTDDRYSFVMSKKLRSCEKARLHSYFITAHLLSVDKKYQVYGKLN